MKLFEFGSLLLRGLPSFSSSLMPNISRTCSQKVQQHLTTKFNARALSLSTRMPQLSQLKPSSSEKEAQPSLANSSESEGKVTSTSGLVGDQNQSNQGDKDPFNRMPSEESLVQLQKILELHLPKFLVSTHPYSLYTPDVIFENLYKEPGKTTVGILPYAIQLTLIRWKIGIKFTNSKLQVLKMTHDVKDGSVKVRWRVTGVRGLKTFIKPWKIKAWQVKETIKNESEWHDGFSILYLRGDGQIYKHTLQRVMTNNEEEEDDKVKNKQTQSDLEVGPTMFKNNN